MTIVEFLFALGLPIWLTIEEVLRLHAVGSRLRRNPRPGRASATALAYRILDADKRA